MCESQMDKNPQRCQICIRRCGVIFRVWILSLWMQHGVRYILHFWSCKHIPDIQHTKRMILTLWSIAVTAYTVSYQKGSNFCSFVRLIAFRWYSEVRNKLHTGAVISHGNGIRHSYTTRSWWSVTIQATKPYIMTAPRFLRQHHQCALWMGIDCFCMTNIGWVKK